MTDVGKPDGVQLVIGYRNLRQSRRSLLRTSMHTGLCRVDDHHAKGRPHALGDGPSLIRPADVFGARRNRHGSFWISHELRANMNTIHNARVTLTATIINNIAAAFAVARFVAPAATGQT